MLGLRGGDYDQLETAPPLDASDAFVWFSGKTCGRMDPGCWLFQSLLQTEPKVSSRISRV